MHPRDLTELVLTQMQTRNDGRPQLVNVSGGVASARSLAQLTQWCTERWGAAEVSSDTTPRPFDLPWVVLDHSLATALWNWQPQTTTEQILREIAAYADATPNWIAASR